MGVHRRRRETNLDGSLFFGGFRFLASTFNSHFRTKRFDLVCCSHPSGRQLVFDQVVARNRSQRGLIRHALFSRSFDRSVFVVIGIEFVHVGLIPVGDLGVDHLRDHLAINHVLLDGVDEVVTHLFGRRIDGHVHIATLDRLVGIRRVVVAHDNNLARHVTTLDRSQSTQSHLVVHTPHHVDLVLSSQNVLHHRLPLVTNPIRRL